MEEIWKDIAGFEGHYQVSNFGNVKSVERFRKSKGNSFAKIKEKILSFKVTKSGYLAVHLRLDSKSFHPTVHRLVAETFIPNKENKPTVNHIDADKTNNTVTNLEWSDSSEQMYHAVKNNLLEPRHFIKFNKTLKKEVLDYYNNNDISITKLAKLFGMSERTAGRIVNNGVIPRKTTRVLSSGEIIIEDVLSNEQVQEIITLRKQGYTLAKLSKMFNRSISQISRVSKGQSRNNNYE